MVKTLIAHLSLRNTTIALPFRSSLTTSVVSIRATKSATKSVLTLRVVFLLIKPVGFYFLVSIVVFFLASKGLSRGEEIERKERDLDGPPTRFLSRMRWGFLSNQ